MQQTCRNCNNPLYPGATTCNFCGAPVVNTYAQQSYPPPPGTQYGTYPQSSSSTDPYAAQYAQPAPPPPPVIPPSVPYGQSAFGTVPQASPFTQSSQPNPFAPAQPPGIFTPTPSGPPRRSPGVLIGVILAVIVLVGGLGAGAYFVFAKRGSTTNQTTTSTPTTPTAIPPLYQDPLTKDSGVWDCSATTCHFMSDGYHVNAPKDAVYSTLLTKQPFDNMVIEIKASVAKGDPKNAGVAVTFRVPQNDTLSGYGILLYVDGTYTIVKWDSQGNPTDLVSNSQSGAIHKGVKQTNDVKVIVNGSTFTLFLNGQQITQTNDSTFSTGLIGLGAIGLNTESVFTNLVVSKPTA